MWLKKKKVEANLDELRKIGGIEFSFGEPFQKWACDLGGLKIFYDQIDSRKMSGFQISVMKETDKNERFFIYWNPDSGFGIYDSLNSARFEYYNGWITDKEVEIDEIAVMNQTAKFMRYCKNNKAIYDFIVPVLKTHWKHFDNLS